jgi:hypothetical protein
MLGTSKSFSRACQMRSYSRGRPRAVLLGTEDPAEAGVEDLGPPGLGLHQDDGLLLRRAFVEDRDLVAAFAPLGRDLDPSLGIGLEEGGRLGAEFVFGDHGR